MLFRFLTWSVSGQPNYMLTSRPYAVETSESCGAVGIKLISGNFRVAFSLITYTGGAEDLGAADLNLTEGSFRATLLNYSYAEELEAGAASITGGVFRVALLDYSYQEDVKAVSLNITNGVFRTAFITYNDGLPESIEAKTFNLIGGSHGS